MPDQKVHVAPRVLVIQPDQHCPLHEMDGWLRREGLEVHQVRPFAGDSVPERVGADGLVVLGGDMSSLDDAIYPWLDDIRRLQRSAAADVLPSFGVCLGGQLMAQAFGGQTGVGDNGMEAGISQIEWLPDAAADRVFADLAVPFLAGMMHRDAVTVLPPGSTLLGTGSNYRHQAFRVGETSWAVQFHPEVNRNVYDSWTAVVGDADLQARQRIARGVDDFARLESVVLKNNQELVRNFAQVVKREVATGRGGARC